MGYKLYEDFLVNLIHGLFSKAILMVQNICCNLQSICTHCAKCERPQYEMKEKLVITAGRQILCIFDHGFRLQVHIIDWKLFV